MWVLIVSVPDHCLSFYFDVVQQITFHFNYSAKRQRNFKNCLSTDAVSSEAMQGRTKLRSLCETRWSARANSLFTFKSAFTTVCSSLEDLAQNYNDPKAVSFLNAVQNFDFIVALIATEHVLSELHLYLSSFRRKNAIY